MEPINKLFNPEFLKDKSPEELAKVFEEQRNYCKLRKIVNYIKDFVFYCISLSIIYFGYNYILVPTFELKTVTLIKVIIVYCSLKILRTLLKD